MGREGVVDDGRGDERGLHGHLHDGHGRLGDPAGRAGLAGELALVLVEQDRGDHETGLEEDEKWFLSERVFQVS